MMPCAIRRFGLSLLLLLLSNHALTPDSEAAPFKVTPLSLPDGLTSISGYEFRRFGELLYFGGGSPAGIKIYRTDGAAIESVIDNPGASPSFSLPFIELDGSIYYGGVNAAITDIELWRFDGNDSTLFADLAPQINLSSNPGPFFRFNDMVLFSASTSLSDWPLFKIQNHTLTPMAGGGFNARQFLELNGEVFFLTSGATLSKTNGSSVTPIGSAGPGQSMAFGKNDGNLYIAQYTSNSEIWKYDGTGFERLIQKPSQCLGCTHGFVEYKGDLYINLSSPRELELFRIDEHEAVQVTNLQGAVFGQNASVYEPRVAGDYLYFTLSTQVSRELYQFDGTTSRKMTEIDPIFATVGSDYASFHNLLLFAADGTEGRELYSYDGVSIQLVADLATGPASSNPLIYNSALVGVHKGEFYFSALDGDNYRLFKLSAVPEPSSWFIAVGCALLLLQQPRRRGCAVLSGVRPANPANAVVCHCFGCYN